MRVSAAVCNIQVPTAVSFIFRQNYFPPKTIVDCLPREYSKFLIHFKYPLCYTSF